MPSKLFTYDEITDVQVRTWNRCAMWFRAGQLGGMEGCKEYTDKLDDIGRQQVVRMLKDIRDRGYTTVRKEITESL